MNVQTDDDLQTKAFRYLESRLAEIDRRCVARENGLSRGMYSKRAILEVVDQVDGSLRMAYILALVSMGDDFYRRVRNTLSEVRTSLSSE